MQGLIAPEDTAPSQRQTLQLDRFQPELKGNDWPTAGTIFVGFRIVSELGRGAFGRVYLATQANLADRKVALKVSTDAAMESQALAQLQHRNIVPIHSLHREGNLYAVCMPYLGATTLSDVFAVLQARVAASASASNSRRSRRSRDQASKSSESISGIIAAKPLPAVRWIERLSHVEGVVKTMFELASGLAHAHENGILHRDLKPANVLLADDGPPMLLDFNLSHDVKRAPDEAATRIGGTVPYMSPEQLRWFYSQSGVGVDERSDIYSLGVIFHELLTMRLPYPLHANAEDWLTRMLRDRESPPVDPRLHEPRISPALASIVMHCLDPDPRRRYANVKELVEDLRRYLDHLPLRFAPDPSRWERTKNWFLRRPKLAAALAVGMVAAIALSSLGGLYLYRGRQLAKGEAVQRFQGFVRDAERKICMLSVRTAERELVHDQSDSVRALLDRYQVFSRTDWATQTHLQLLDPDQRLELLHVVGDLLIQLGYAEWLEGQAASEPGERRAHGERALHLNRLAEQCYGPEAVPKALWMQRKTLADQLGDSAEAILCESRRKQTPIRSARERMLVVSDRTAHRAFNEALVYLEEASSALVANDFWGLFLRGVCHKSQNQRELAACCFTGCIALRPDLPEPYIFRSRCLQELKQFPAALADLNVAVEHPDVSVDVICLRAVLLQRTGNPAAALREIDRAIELGGNDPRALRLRASLRGEQGDSHGAMLDREAAAENAGDSEAGWIAVGWQAQDVDCRRAVECFNKALRINPMSREALHKKSYTLVKHKVRTQETLDTLDRLVGLYADDLMARKARGLLNAQMGNLAAAYADADSLLAADKQPASYFQAARIYAQTSRRQPADAERALQHLQRAFAGNYGRDLALTDPDLEPLKTEGKLQKLVAEAAKSAARLPLRREKPQSRNSKTAPRR